jgi:hypothetical protein
MGEEMEGELGDVLVAYESDSDAVAGRGVETGGK